MNVAPILCVAITPAVQRTLFFTGYRAGEVNRARRTLVSAAGKGVNVALALANLGERARLVGFRGGDSGMFIAQEVAQRGIDARWVEVAAPTRHCHTLVESDSGRVTELVEEAVPPDHAAWSRFESVLQAAAAGCSWLALSGAMPPGSPPDMLARLCALGVASGLRVCVDSQGSALRACLPAHPAIVKLNAEELAQTCRVDQADDDAMRRAAASLLQQGAGVVLVTDGPHAARLYSAAGPCVLPVPRVKALNPIGSGDSVTAGLLHALQAGQSLEAAARFGLACGSANAETETPAQFAPGRVRELLAGADFGS